MEQGIKKVPLRSIVYRMISAVRKADTMYTIGVDGLFDDGIKDAVDWAELSDVVYENGPGVFNVKHITSIKVQNIYQVVEDKIVLRDVTEFKYILEESKDMYESCILRLLSLIHGLDYIVTINTLDDQPDKIEIKDKKNIEQLRKSLGDPGNFFKIRE